jgi:heme oxygenase
MADHRDAETSTLMTDLFNGRVTSYEYASLLRQLQAVYLALDTAATDARTDPDCGAFFAPGLDRTSAIEQDLAHLPNSQVPLTRATLDYVERISSASFPWIGRLVAHHYTRYLGDLSGGQAIAAKLSANLGLSPERGLTFYQFPEVGPTPRFKNHYRRLLDTVNWSYQQQDDFITEVKAAYRLNLGVFQSLDALR